MDEKKYPPVVTKSGLITIGIIVLVLTVITFYFLAQNDLLRGDELIIFAVVLPLVLAVCWFGCKLGIAAFRKKEKWAIKTFKYIVYAFIAISIIRFIISFWFK
ncbi:hypothetical protein ACFL42_00790 [Candidatus Omnitrophota bacterium]